MGEVHEPSRGRLVGLAREHDAGGGRVRLADAREQLGAVLPGHPHVRDQDVDRLLGHQREGLPAALGEMHLPAVAVPPQPGAQRVEQQRLVVDEQDPRHARASRPSTGRRTSKVVPRPVSVSKRTVPPCFSQTRA